MIRLEQHSELDSLAFTARLIDVQNGTKLGLSLGKRQNNKILNPLLSFKTVQLFGG